MGNPPVAVGSVLAGKYRVDRVLGVGGMGIVVAATHLHLFQPVALKFMLPEALSSGEMVQRFLQEARSACRLHSQHVCRISDVGTLENGAPYIVMEYLQGTDLGAVKERQGSLTVPVAVDLVLQACEAIAEAHGLGIVHRDLKPANLFVTQGADGSPLVKVLDFGIAKATGAGDLQMTRTATVMGSPAYMSPEQLRSARSVDARSDIWSLGVILYELVTARMPFLGETLTELCLRISMDPLPPMPKLQGSAIPPGFEAVVRRCLEKSPDQRYPSVAAMAADLARFGPPQSMARAERIGRILAGVGTAGQAGRGPADRAGSVDQTIDRLTRPPVVRRPRGLIIGGAIGGAAVVLGVAAALLAGGSKSPLPSAGGEKPVATAVAPRPPTPVVAVTPDAATAPPPPQAPDAAAAPALTEAPPAAPDAGQPVAETPSPPSRVAVVKVPPRRPPKPAPTPAPAPIPAPPSKKPFDPLSSPD